MLLEILFLQILCVAVGAATATLEVDPDMTRDRPSFIICTTSKNITMGVFFYTDGDVVKGNCAVPGALCVSSFQGYSVTQNVTSRTTTLSIDSVNCTRETGSWYCKHGNDTESSPRVYIGCNTTKYAPSIDKTRFPSTFIAVKGRQLYVNCASYTTPGHPSNTSYTWTRPDGSSTSGSTLQVNNVTTSDAGQYTCRASNNFSSPNQDSATLQLTVQFPPTVSDQDSSYQVTELSPLNIDCRNYTTVGNPSSTGYIWTGPKSFMSSQPILSIRRISRNQTGTYTCRASNNLTPTGGSEESGIGEGNFSVDVQYAPSIDKSRFPSTFIAVKGRQLSVNCASYSTPGHPSSTNYTWTRHGGTSSAGSTLHINNVTTSDAENYTCRASNDFSSSQQGQDSATLKLTVQFAPTVSGQDSSYQVTELSPLKIDCRNYATVGNPPSTSYRWTGPNSFSSSQSTLSISSINRTQAGTYTCWANNTLTPTGESMESGIGEGEFVVGVQYPPDISLSIVEGQQDWTLTCTAAGIPSNYMFEDFGQYWGDQLIQRRGGTQAGDRYSLDLPQVSYQDSGVYVCTVGNNIKPPNRKNITVTVQTPPVYTNGTDTTEPTGAEIGHTVTLDEYVYCSPNFTSVSWHFNTTNTNTSTLSTDSSSVSSSRVQLDVYHTEVEVWGFKLVYTVTNFKLEDIGVYTVSVCNSVGCSNSSLNLIASGPPETPLHFTALNSTTDSVTLTWTPQYAGGDYTQEFHVEFRVQNTSGDWSSRVFTLSQVNSGAVVVDGLDSNTVYVFRIKSVTDRKTGNNQSVFSKQIYVTTEELPKVPQNAPLPIGGIVGGIVGGLACFILVAVLLVFLRRRMLNKGGDSERPRSGRNGDIVMSAVGGAEATTTNNAGVIYAEVKKKKKPVTDVYTEVKKPDKRQQKKDDVYENAVPRQHGDDANTYANAGFEGDQPKAKYENPQPPTGRDADGCLYVGIDFSNQKPGMVIIGKEKGSYVDIAYGKVGPPLLPDEDEEQ